MLSERKFIHNLTTKLERLTDLLVEGHILPDVYKNRHQEIALRQKELTCMLGDSHDANDKFKEALSDVLLLTSKSGDLFESSKTEEKRRILGFVFSNLKLEGATLRYSLRKPFEQFAQLPNPEWRPLLVAIRTHFREDVLNLHKILPPSLAHRSLMS